MTPVAIDAVRRLAGPLDAVLLKLHAAREIASMAILRPHPLIGAVLSDDGTVLFVSAVLLRRGRDLLKPYAANIADGSVALVVVGDVDGADLLDLRASGVMAVIDGDAGERQIAMAVLAAFELISAKTRAESRGRWLSRYRYELSEIVEIAKAISTEREIDKLLDLILEKSRFITGADAGSLYVVEGDDPDPLRRSLRFKLTQNDSLEFSFREFTVPISARSMSGYVALHKSPLNIADVYDLPVQSPFGFDRSFDMKNGYRTKSMLCVPLTNRVGDVIGVIQLINKKRDPEAKLRHADDVERQVQSFDERSEELLMTLAAQAGIALENATLYQEIRRMLEGFVQASVEAIEQRDPTTSGHSRRVADVTVNLARAVESATTGPYKDVRFTRDDLRELEYASLLHDFGKIGVREEVLVKAKKLYPFELEQIRLRFEFAIRSIEADMMRRKLSLIERGATAEDLALVDGELARRQAEIETAFDAVVAANEPTILNGGDFAKVEAIARETFVDLRGRERPLLSGEEVKSLSVTRGSLTTQEIDEIRSHVTHTFEFLSQIPWGKQFRRVAQIAGSHHERLNGTGYPNRLRAEEIPLQSKLMSIADIFDALTASDRPYKKAVPVEKALDILGFEVRDQHVDGDLVRIFVEARAWEPPKP